MTNEFKVGDRVKNKNSFLNNSNIYEVEFILCEKLLLRDIISHHQFSEHYSFFELVERKIGNIWFKLHELYISPSCSPPENDKQMKEEFKIDKPGWYESNESEKYLLISKELNHGDGKCCLFLSKDKTDYILSELDGTWRDEEKIIKYLGQESPKEYYKAEIITGLSCIHGEKCIKVDMSGQNEMSKYKIIIEELSNE